MAKQVKSGQTQASSSSTDLAPAAAELVKLLADPTRRRIFLLVLGREICNCELASALGVPQNLVSHHVAKLRQAGFVDEHPDPADGRWSHFTVQLEALQAAWEGLEAALHPSRLGERTPACRVRSTETLPGTRRDGARVGPKL
ncbi:MAG TPA: metalloregulator ArsR/SmtB family transcription factor [Acidimicrobiales bacterium]|nr:metalloregulator ArsR/SmtB family transcription factor [Acidimicrobiales bacterium]